MVPHDPPETFGVSQLSHGDCGTDSALWVFDSHFYVSNHSFL